MSTAIASHTDISPYRALKRTMLQRKSNPASDSTPLNGAQDRIIAAQTANLLLIDDDAKLIADGLRRAGHLVNCRVHAAKSADEALRLFRADAPDVILLGWKVSGQPGMEIYQKIRLINAHVPIILICCADRADSTIEAMRRGAYDCVSKPLDLHQLRCVVSEALDVAAQMRRPTASAVPQSDAGGNAVMIGNCPEMREVYKAIGRVTDRDVTVLITGDSGTGKELVARAIYQHSHRASGPFLALNCAAIPEDLLESELFGHEKGAFTGAEHRRIGKFEQCHGGTLFLDEIGDMPLAMQAKMLRVIQEQSFQRVGGNETVHANVRLIAATHHDLKQDAAEGKFRSDLYYRLGGFTIHLPPLRERGNDLESLIRYYLHRCSGELGCQIQEISPEALERLRRYPWPGNIRELKSVLKQALLRAHGTVLASVFLPALAGEVDVASRKSSAVDDSNLELLLDRSSTSDPCELYAEAHRQLDRHLLPRVLEDAEGNQHQAARRLGIARETLRRRMRELGLQVARHTFLLGQV